LETDPDNQDVEPDDDDIREDEDLDEHTDEPAEGAGYVGPPEDIEGDPAYDPDDPELRRIKGG
jgi:hypothetical protein